jgi:hypothetical protein
LTGGVASEERMTISYEIYNKKLFDIEMKNGGNHETQSSVKSVPELFARLEKLKGSTSLAWKHLFRMNENISFLEFVKILLGEGINAIYFTDLFTQLHLIRINQKAQDENHPTIGLASFDAKADAALKKFLLLLDYDLWQQVDRHGDFAVSQDDFYLRLTDFFPASELDSVWNFFEGKSSGFVCWDDFQGILSEEKWRNVPNSSNHRGYFDNVASLAPWKTEFTGNFSEFKSFLNQKSPSLYVFWLKMSKCRKSIGIAEFFGYMRSLGYKGPLKMYWIRDFGLRRTETLDFLAFTGDKLINKFHDKLVKYTDTWKGDRILSDSAGLKGFLRWVDKEISVECETAVVEALEKILPIDIDQLLIIK